MCSYTFQSLDKKTYLHSALNSKHNFVLYMHPSYGCLHFLDFSINIGQERKDSLKAASFK
ncbi:hypothetical protein BCV71DRAFT_7044 [Rhizopus microsporus]|uniref:Uncharacterized protein n=1 Tax=Rhizopus microsporus TaxID=58291 RepID=A0A1X0RYL9_RHIZD|nr:hypothetical protein BCV71DRAFT_7044 [Rhizopus microsporus]